MLQAALIIGVLTAVYIAAATVVSVADSVGREIVGFFDHSSTFGTSLDDAPMSGVDVAGEIAA